MAEKNVQADLELKKAFAELQAKTVETRRKMKIADIQIETLKREKTHAELTEKEISTLDPSTRMYESVGRLFIYKDNNTIKKHLKERHEKANEKIKNLENSKVFLDRNIKESENNLREMVQQWKNKSDD